MDHKINNEISADTVRVIGSDGKQIGILSLAEALGLAYSEDMDLVLLSDKQTPFTCQIMNYSKYKYEQSKRQKENKKKNKAITTKEIVLSYSIQKHDLDTKVKQIKKFLEHKNKVNVLVRLKGREKLYMDKAVETLELVKSECDGLYLSAEINKVNDSITMLVLSPLK